MLLENIQGRLKMEFPHYDCFPAITKLTVELHAIRESKSRAIIVVVLKERRLMLLIYSHFTSAIPKKCVLKYDKNNYANIVTMWMYLGYTVNRITKLVLQNYGIIRCLEEKISLYTKLCNDHCLQEEISPSGCDTASFFCINGQTNPSKEVLKSQAV